MSERVGEQIVDVTVSHFMTEIAEVAKVAREFRRSSASASTPHMAGVFTDETET